MILENVGNSDYANLLKGTTVSTDANGQYKAIVRSYGDGVLARGYLVYLDGDNNLTTVYTGIISANE